jgi:hypothetical protein
VSGVFKDILDVFVLISVAFVDMLDLKDPEAVTISVALVVMSCLKAPDAVVILVELDVTLALSAPEAVAMSGAENVVPTRVTPSPAE